MLEELGSVDELFCRRESFVGCVGRHDGMQWSFLLYLYGVCGSVASGLRCQRSLRDRPKVAVVGMRVSGSEDAICSLVL